MKTATQYQFWLVPRLARTILVIVAGLMLFVVTASMIERPAPEPKASQGSERKDAPGLPDRHHRIDVLA